MRRYRVSFPVLLLLAAAACAAPPPPAPDLAAEEAAIRAISERWLELETAGDLAGIAALFTDDGVLIREDVEPVTGHAAIAASLTANKAENPSAVPNWATDRVEVAASGDLAVEYGTWSVTGIGADGAGSDSGRYVTVYRKVNGVWMVAADASLSTKPESAATTPTT